MLVALDDTDGLDGGCTTHVAHRLAERLGPTRVDGHLRLVRLNPANPYKTRGNAAVAIPLSEGSDPGRVLDAAADLVREHARIAEDKGAGVAVLDQPPPGRWYERGVREQIPLDEAQAALADARTFTMGTGRGLVGALCAAAWRPHERSHTFTRIAYREPERRGTPRDVDEDLVRELAEAYPETFDCWDARDEHAAVAPRTPCPVLYGVRATRPGRLAEATGELAEEPLAGARTFVTNQATDDHLDPSTPGPVRVTATPETLEGGHVRVPAETDDGRAVDLMAFAPTGGMRAPLRELAPGDRVLGLGGGPDGQVNLEKALVVPDQRSRAPSCPGCGGRMRSTGASTERRCPRCGTRRAAETEHPDAFWVEADTSARRHLARPLELGLARHVARAVDRLAASFTPAG